MPLLRFILSPAGRVARVVIGLALIGVGALQRRPVSRWGFVGVGLVPLIAGGGDLCVVGPLVGQPLSGASARARTHTVGTFGQAG